MVLPRLDWRVEGGGEGEGEPALLLTRQSALLFFTLRGKLREFFSEFFYVACVCVCACLSNISFVVAIRGHVGRRRHDEGPISSICLHAAFTPADPESAKSCLSWSVFFALLGSACVKAARKMFLKLTQVRLFLKSIVECDDDVGWKMKSFVYLLELSTVHGTWFCRVTKHSVT